MADAPATPASGPTPAAVPAPLDDPSLRPFLDQSPTLRAGIDRLGNDRVAVVWGEPGQGTRYDPTNGGRIIIDPSQRGNGAQIAGSLAHEIGHHEFREPQDLSSREAYLRNQLRGEAAATINSAQVRQEIIDKGGADIGIAGTGDRPRQYIDIAGQLRRGEITQDQARDRIGDVFKTETPSTAPGKTYEQYYGEWYDRTYGARTRATSPEAQTQGADPTARTPASTPQPEDPMYRAVRGALPASVSDEQAMHAAVLARQEGIAADRVKASVHNDNVWISQDFPPGFRTRMGLSEPVPSMAESTRQLQALPSKEPPQATQNVADIAQPTLPSPTLSR